MSAAVFGCLAVTMALLTPVSSAAADPPPPSVHLTNGDDGRTLDLPAGTELQVDLTPTRDGDVWQVGASGYGVDVHTLDESVSGTTMTVRVNGATTLSGVTDAACTHGSPPCDRSTEHWSVHVTVPSGPVPPNPAATACTSTPATPTAGIRIITTADDRRGVTVHQGDVLLVDLQCPGSSLGDPWTVPSASGTPPPLFRQQVSGRSDLHAVQARFTTEAPGRSALTWTSDVRCTPSSGTIACYGRPSQLFHVAIGVVPPGTAIDPRADQCVQTLTVANPYPLADTAVGLAGQADPGATVQVWFRKQNASAFSMRRTLTADSAGRYATSFVADAAYDVYATAGTACQTYPQHVDVRPRVAGPAAVRRGTTVTLTVHGLPSATVTLAFRPQGQTTFVVRRRAQLDSNGRYVTTYRADADYRYVVRDETHYLTGNTGLTQTR